MAFNITEFSSVIGRKGLASSNKFQVQIYLPGGTNNPDLDIMCDSASLAGKSIATMTEINYGIRREVAYAAPTYDDLTLTFYCTEKLEEKKILDRWQNQIVKTNGLNKTGGSFDVGYYDDYAGSSKVVVTKLSVSGEPTFVYEYVETFPKSITAMELSHAQTSSPMKVSAVFKYIYWKDIT